MAICMTCVCSVCVWSLHFVHRFVEICGSFLVAEIVFSVDLTERPRTTRKTAQLETGQPCPPVPWFPVGRVAV